ncbi:MAG: lysophospholipid acyltransferase family protein [Ramlibacter sp.]|nr:lysophospholipid acyltransferase family protein [Ramlibacter sp.]
MLTLFRVLSILPLWLLHSLGWALGWAAFLGSGVYRRRFLANLAQAGLPLAAVRRAVGESGKLVAELPRLWFGAPVPVRWDGAPLIDAAQAHGRGIVFLTPHLGCFEVTAQGYAARYGAQRGPITVLYRPARKAWLRGLVDHSRGRPGLATAPTTLAGVKQMLKALKAGEAVGLLPDQVPPLGQGVWAPFFGRDAYTMTLSARLAHQTGALVLLAWGERLPWGRGFVIHVRPLPQALAPEPGAAAAQVNEAMAQLVRECPWQYLWGYARYKAPREEPRAAAAAATNQGAA